MKVKKDGELKDMTCRFWMIKLLLHYLNTFRQLLRERAMYGLSGFDVTRRKNHFKLSVSVVAIRLYKFKVPAVANSIPFRFSKLEQVIALINTNVQLQRLETGVCQPRVMIATSNNPKFVGAMGVDIPFLTRRFFHGRYIDKESISDAEVMLIQAECILKKALKINKISRLETTTAHVQPALGRSTFKETLVLAEECTVHSRRHSRKSNL
ncbi:unnamed protein product [Brassica oleracea]